MEGSPRNMKIDVGSRGGSKSGSGSTPSSSSLPEASLSPPGSRPSTTQSRSRSLFSRSGGRKERKPEKQPVKPETESGIQCIYYASWSFHQCIRLLLWRQLYQLQVLSMATRDFIKRLMMCGWMTFWHYEQCLKFMSDKCNHYMVIALVITVGHQSKRLLLVLRKLRMTDIRVEVNLRIKMFPLIFPRIKKRWEREDHKNFEDLIISCSVIRKRVEVEVSSKKELVTLISNYSEFVMSFSTMFTNICFFVCLFIYFSCAF